MNFQKLVVYNKKKEPYKIYLQENKIIGNFTQKLNYTAAVLVYKILLYVLT
jgi:hypothetical protein